MPNQVLDFLKSFSVVSRCSPRFYVERIFTDWLVCVCGLKNAFSSCGRDERADARTILAFAGTDALYNLVNSRRPRESNRATLILGMGKASQTPKDKRLKVLVNARQRFSHPPNFQTDGTH